MCAGQFHSIGARYEQDGSYPDQKETADEGKTFQYVDVFGIEAFLPGSQIDVKPIRDYDQYVNKTMEFKVVKISFIFS